MIYNSTAPPSGPSFPLFLFPSSWRPTSFRAKPRLKNLVQEDCASRRQFCQSPRQCCAWEHRSTLGPTTRQLDQRVTQRSINRKPASTRSSLPLRSLWWKCTRLFESTRRSTCRMGARAREIIPGRARTTRRSVPSKRPHRRFDFGEWSAHGRWSVCRQIGIQGMKEKLCTEPTLLLRLGNFGCGISFERIVNCCRCRVS